eukprot:s2189_g8.t1
MLQDVERPKYLQNIDLGLKDSDQAAHSPLIAIAKLFCQRNLRVRTEQSDNRRRGRRGQRQPRYWQRDDEEEEIEVEETEEENEPIGRLRSTTPSSGARLHGQQEQAKAAGRFENPNRRIPVTPPKTPPAPPPRRRERSVTPPGRNTQRRTERPPVKTPPRRPPSQQRTYLIRTHAPQWRAIYEAGGKDILVRTTVELDSEVVAILSCGDVVEQAGPITTINDGVERMPIVVKSGRQNGDSHKIVGWVTTDASAADGPVFFKLIQEVETNHQKRGRR